jgi:hypothetical protein
MFCSMLAKSYCVAICPSSPTIEGGRQSDDDGNCDEEEEEEEEEEDSLDAAVVEARRMVRWSRRLAAPAAAELPLVECKWRLLPRNLVVPHESAKDLGTLSADIA